MAGVDVFSSNDAFPGGGGGTGLTNWTEGVNIAAPNATTPVTSFTATNAATNVDAALIAKGTGATLAQVPDSLTTGGNKRGQYATDWQKSRTSITQVAGGDYSTISGGLSNSAIRAYCTVGGGQFNTAGIAAGGSHNTIGGGNNNATRGSYTTIAGGANHQAYVDYAAICGGQTNAISADKGFIGGGASNTISGVTGTGYSAVIAGGQGNAISGNNNFYPVIAGGSTNSIVAGANVLYGMTICGGESNSVSHSYATVVGGKEGKSNYQGEVVSANGKFVTVGDAQQSLVTLRRSLASAGSGELTLDGGVPVASGATANILTLPNNSTLSYDIQIVARDTGTTGQNAYWFIRGAIKRDVGVATTAIVGTNFVATQNSAGNSAGWTCVAVADSATNGALQINVSNPTSTGAVRWVASITLVRVTN